jgi:hypothetical protein
MEDIRDVYKRPYNPDEPVVCMDEQPTQLIKETRVPLAAQPGRPKRVDYEYERNGTATTFMFTEPLASWRKVSVRERKTSVDGAHEIKHLLDEEYPTVRKLVRLGGVVLVCDNLNTHKPAQGRQACPRQTSLPKADKPASLYEAFEPEEAHRLLQRLEIHYTPKHGSRLNIAECEFSAFTRQCLDRRIADIGILRQHATAGYHQRNAGQKSVDWHFTTHDARTKLKRLYPQIQMTRTTRQGIRCRKCPITSVPVHVVFLQ